MNKTLYGYTPNENSSLDLDRSNTHNHNIETKKPISMEFLHALYTNMT